jgi:type II secretory pathway component PulF
MGQMTTCPRCGAANSIRRATCYACEAPLAAPAQRARGADDRAGRRFDAVLADRSRRRPEVEAAAPAALPSFYPGGLQLRRAMLLFRQLHSLVQAGIPLSQALMDLQARIAPPLKGPLRAMAQHVSSGGRLSEAMSHYPNIFLQYHLGLVNAGELSGALPQALDQIASDCEVEAGLRRGIGLALLPVSFIALVMLAVLPVALALREPPPAGQWTLAALSARYAAKALTVSLPIVLGAGGLWALWAAAARSPRRAALKHRLALSVPIIGAAHRRSGMMRFLGSLSLLLGAGVPLTEAYRSSAGAAGNSALTRELLREAENLHAGRGLADTLGRLRVISGTAKDRMAVGETVGKLPETLGQIAADYRRHAERSARYLPLLVQLAAYVVIAPLAALLYFTVVKIFLHYRFYAPLKELFNAP